MTTREVEKTNKDDDVADMDNLDRNNIPQEKIFYLEHVKIFNDIPRRQINSLPRIRYWDENSITKITRKVYDLGGLDSIQVGLRKDVTRSCTVEDVRVEMIKLRSELKEEILSCSLQLAEFKKEMSDSVSNIMTILSTIQCQVQCEANKPSQNLGFEDVHAPSRNHEVNKADSSEIRFKKMSHRSSPISRDFQEGISNLKTPNKGSTDEKMEDFELKDQKIDVEKIVGDDGSMHEDSTNPYNKFDDIVGKYNEKLSYAKGNVMNISDDVSSLKILSQGNKNNEVTEDGQGIHNDIGATSSTHKQKRKIHQHDIDDSESLIFRNDDYRSREDASIGLRRKSSLKVGPQHKSPYVNVSSVGSGRSRGRGRGRGGRHINKRGRGGRKSKTTTSDEKPFDETEDCDHVGALEDSVENFWVYINTMKGLFITPSDVLVDFDTNKLTREDLTTIHYNQCVSSKVIDIVVDGLSLSYKGFGDRSIWFMPWAFTNQVLQWFERPSTEQLIKQYKHLYMGDIALCKQIFLPICDQVYNHWYLGIANISGKEAVLLDSFPAKDDSARKSCLQQLLLVLDDIVRHESFGYEENSDIPSMSTFEVKTFPVCQQNNGTDCGVHLMQYMRYCPTNMRDITMQMHGLNARKEIVDWLLLHPNNKQRHNNIMGATTLLQMSPEFQLQRRKDMRALKALNKQAKESLRQAKLPRL
ncbi:hypothetical protein LINPERHAP1_LOCUS24005 [Linum perenne]